MIDPLIQKAYKILNGKDFDKDFFKELSKLKGEDILDLVSLANRVKNRFAKETHVCTIMNAKSGICKEDCRFCAQSSHHKTDAETYRLCSKEEILGKAKETYKSGVSSFGIVTSGTGYMKINDEFREITEAIDSIYKLYPDKNVCASLGNLSEENAKELAKHKVAHYNINIQTNPKKYNQLISTTHDVDQRIETIKHLKNYGVKICSGGIIGIGETMDDRIEMAFALKELDVDVIPLNVLIPVEGTPLENQKDIPVAEIAKTFAIYRLIHPSKTIKFAAGRETKMKDFQGLLMLAGANGFITGWYLTTRGRNVKDDMLFNNELSLFR